MVHHRRLFLCILSAWMIFLLVQLRLLTILHLRDVTRNADSILGHHPNLKQKTPPDLFLSPFVANFVRGANDSHLSYRQQVCEKDTSKAVLEEWKNHHRRLSCAAIFGEKTSTTTELLVDEYVLTRWEHQPTIFRYTNVGAWSMRGPTTTSARCRPFQQPSMALEQKNGTLPIENKDASPQEIHVNATVIRIVPFDVSNAYERFHAYLNVAMIMIMFDVKDPQLVLISEKETNERDLEMWRLFSKLEPMVLPNHEIPSSLPKARYVFREIIDAPGSALSMINTKSTEWDGIQNKTGALRGRGADHECQSVLLQAILQWIRKRAAAVLGHKPSKMDSEDTTRIRNSSRRRPIQVLWSSRQPYSTTFQPKRILDKENEWIMALSTRLGERFTVAMVDFGTLSVVESIRVVEESDILVGVHGAGLIWSAFLGTTSDPTRTSSTTGGTFGLVEIFGGDRDPTNRHYHNLASLVGMEYRETRFWKGSDALLRWNEKRLDEVVSQIRSIVGGGDAIAGGTTSSILAHE